MSHLSGTPAPSVVGHATRTSSFNTTKGRNINGDGSPPLVPSFLPLQPSPLGSKVFSRVQSVNQPVAASSPTNIAAIPTALQPQSSTRNFLQQFDDDLHKGKMKTFEGQATYYDQQHKPLLAAKALERALDEKLDYLLSQQMHQQLAQSSGKFEASRRTSIMSVTSTTGGGGEGSFSAHASWVGRSGASVSPGGYAGSGAIAAAEATASSRPQSAAFTKGSPYVVDVSRNTVTTPTGKVSTTKEGGSSGQGKWATNLTRAQYQQQLQHISKAATLVDRCQTSEEVATLVERIVTKYNACAMAALSTVPSVSHPSRKESEADDCDTEAIEAEAHNAQLSSALDLVGKAFSYLKTPTQLLYEESLKTQKDKVKTTEDRQQNKTKIEAVKEEKEEDAATTIGSTDSVADDDDIKRAESRNTTDNPMQDTQDQPMTLLPHFTVTRLLLENEEALGDYAHLVSLLGYPTPPVANNNPTSANLKPQPPFGSGSRGFSLTRPNTAESKGSASKTPMPTQPLVLAQSDDEREELVSLSHEEILVAQQNEFLAIGERQARVPLWETFGAGYGYNTISKKGTKNSRSKDDGGSLKRTGSIGGGSPVATESPIRSRVSQQNQPAPITVVTSTPLPSSVPIATNRHSRFLSFNDTMAQQKGMLFNWYFSTPQLTSVGQSDYFSTHQRRQQSPTAGSASDLSFQTTASATTAAKKALSKPPTQADMASIPDLQTLLSFLLAARLMRLRVITLNNLGCILRRKRQLKDALACMASASAIEQRLTKLLAQVVKNVYGTRLGCNGIVGTNVGVATVLGLDTVHTPFVLRQLALEKTRQEEIKQVRRALSLQHQQALVGGSPSNNRPGSMGGVGGSNGKLSQRHSPTGSTATLSPQQQNIAGALARQTSLDNTQSSALPPVDDNTTLNETTNVAVIQPVVVNPTVLTQISLASNVTDAVRLMPDTHREVAERINKKYYEWLKALQDLSESPFLCTPLTNMSSLSIAMGKYPEGLAYASEAVAQFLNFENVLKAKISKMEQNRLAKVNSGSALVSPSVSNFLGTGDGALTRVPSNMANFGASSQLMGETGGDLSPSAMGPLEGIPKTTPFYKGTVYTKEHALLAQYQGLGAVLFQNLAIAMEPTDTSGALRSFGVAIERATAEFGEDAPPTLAIIANRDSYVSWLDNRYRSLVAEPQQEFPFFQQLTNGGGAGGAGRRQSIRRQSLHTTVAAILGGNPPESPSSSTRPMNRPSSGSTRQPSTGMSPSSPTLNSPKGRTSEGGKRGASGMTSSNIGFANVSGLPASQLTPLQQQQLLAAGYPPPQTQADLLDAQTVVLLAAGLQTATSQGPIAASESATSPRRGRGPTSASIVAGSPTSPYGRTGSTISLSTTTAGRGLSLSNTALAPPNGQRPSSAAAISEQILRAQAIQTALAAQPAVVNYLGTVPPAKVGQVGRMQRLETYKADHSYDEDPDKNKSNKGNNKSPNLSAAGHSAPLSIPAGQKGIAYDLNNNSFASASNMSPVGSSLVGLGRAATAAFTLNTSAISTASAPPSVLLLSDKFADSHLGEFGKGDQSRRTSLRKASTAVPLVVVSSMPKTLGLAPPHQPLASRPSVGFQLSIDDSAVVPTRSMPKSNASKSAQQQQIAAEVEAKSTAVAAAQRTFFDPSFAGLILEVETPLQRVGEKVNAEDAAVLKTALQQMTPQQPGSQQASSGLEQERGTKAQQSTSALGMLPMVPKPPVGTTSFLPPQLSSSGWYDYRCWLRGVLLRPSIQNC